MEYFLQQKLQDDKKFRKYFEENSGYVKYLNRNPENYRVFMHKMKELYKERTTDKISDAINTIDIISSILDTMK